MALYKGHRYRWKGDNKNSSHYVCTDPSCYASVTVNGDEVVKSRGKHLHEALANSNVLILEATQELKQLFFLLNSESLNLGIILKYDKLKWNNFPKFNLE